MAVKRFAVSIPEKIAEQFEKSIENSDYENRSKAVAEALSEFSEKKLERRDIEVGAIVIKGANNSKAKSRLDRIKSHYEDIIISTFREGERKTFIDIWIMKGKECILTRIKNRLNITEGVSGCWLVSLRNGIAGNDYEFKSKMVLEEDIGPGDITSEMVVPENTMIEALIRANEPGIFCGSSTTVEKLGLYDERVFVNCLKKEGSEVKKGEIIIRLSGPARSILACERTMLNLLMRLSGIATNTARFVEAIKPHKAELLDTRKNIPGYRRLEKDAVRFGGGKNHRMGLYDGILVKNTHIAIVGSVKEATMRAKKAGMPVEVEVRTLAELEEAIGTGADRVLLDNMSVEDIKQAVKITNGRAKLEASGGVTLENINEIAATGVDYISVGSALTLSAPALDFSLEITAVK